MSTKPFLAGLLSAVAAFSQAPPPTQKPAVSQQKGDSELGLFSGAVFSPFAERPKIGAGANYAYALNKYVYPYGEVSFLPVGTAETVKLGNTSFEYNARLADLHGGIHLRLPVNNRFVPYGVIAVGGFRSFSASLEERNLQSGTLINSRKLPSLMQFAFNYGGGIRYYLNNKLGLRFEVKGYGPTGNFGGTPIRIMGGIFFQFKRK